MIAISNPFFWIVIFELLLCGVMLTNQDKTIEIISRFELSLRIGFATTLLFLSGGTYCSIITIEKDGEIIEEYNIGDYL